jgi:protein TonB
MKKSFIFSLVLTVLGQTQAIIFSPQLLALADTQPKLVKIGGRAMEEKILEKPAPEYPPAALAQRITGVVQLEIIVDTQGAPRQLKVLHGHPLLVHAALKAVSKWRYQPTTLNGEPVEVLTSVDVIFQLK